MLVRDMFGVNKHIVMMMDLSIYNIRTLVVAKLCILRVATVERLPFFPSCRRVSETAVVVFLLSRVVLQPLGSSRFAARFG